MYNKGKEMFLLTKCQHMFSFWISLKVVLIGYEAENVTSKILAAHWSSSEVKSTLDWICHPGHGLGVGGRISVVLIQESSVRSVISVVSLDCDTLEVLAASVVVVEGGWCNTWDLTDFIILAICLYLACLAKGSLGLS